MLPPAPEQLSGQAEGGATGEAALNGGQPNPPARGWGYWGGGFSWAWLVSLPVGWGEDASGLKALREG